MTVSVANPGPVHDALIKYAIAVLLVGALPVSAAAADIYKWIDADGKVHYGDHAPDRNAHKLEIDSAAAPADPGREARRKKQQRLLDALEKEHRDLEAKRAKEKEDAARREKNCLAAKDKLRSVQNASYLYVLGKDGRRRIISDAERTKVTTRWKEAVKQWCQ